MEVTMRIINCHNFYHLGDCIETLHYLLNASKCNDVKFHFFCNPSYRNQLQEMIDNDDSVLLLETPGESSIDTWIGAYSYGEIAQQAEKLFNSPSNQGSYFFLLWKIFSDLHGLKCPFSELNDMIYNQEVLSRPCAHSQKYDYLFINSKPLSLPYENFEQETLDFLKLLDKHNKTVITTRKIENYPCTLDYNLSVVEIGKLSKNVKNVVSVNTGPLHLCMNKWSLTNIETFTIWTPSETFNYGKIFKTVKNLKGITIQ